MPTDAMFCASHGQCRRSPATPVLTLLPNLRAHANGVENLPVYAAIVVLASLAGVATRELDARALALIVARIGQSIVHIGFVETTTTVGVRFTLFFVQLVAMIAMAVHVVAHAGCSC